jgi:hypothetical protein
MQFNVWNGEFNKWGPSNQNNVTLSLNSESITKTKIQSVAESKLSLRSASSADIDNQRIANCLLSLTNSSVVIVNNIPIRLPSDSYIPVVRRIQLSVEINRELFTHNSLLIFKQNNDQFIDCSITLNNVPISAIDIDNAVYNIYSTNKKTVKLTKRLDAGITVKDNTLTIQITREDCKNLRGVFYHELTIVDHKYGQSTVFKNEMTFQSTSNLLN